MHFKVIIAPHTEVEVNLLIPFHYSIACRKFPQAHPPKIEGLVGDVESFPNSFG